MKTLFKLVFTSNPRSMSRNVARRVVVCCGCVKYSFFPLLSPQLPTQYDWRSALKTYHLPLKCNFDLEGKHVKLQLLHVSEG